MRYEMRLEGAVVCSWLEGGLRLVRGDSSWGGVSTPPCEWRCCFLGDRMEFPH
jgi:hypothetical protein